jgi:hypothetical protein
MIDYEALGQKIGRLVCDKQEAYGDSFGKSGEILRILYPAGIPLDAYDDMLAVVRIIDKCFRIATARDALGESPYRDIAGYGLLGAARVEQQRACLKNEGIHDPTARR